MKLVQRIHRFSLSIAMLWMTLLLFHHYFHRFSDFYQHFSGFHHYQQRMNRINRMKTPKYHNYLHNNNHNHNYNHHNNNNNNQQQEHIVASLIIIKLPRSGSSWFTRILNQRYDVFISKEIIQSNQSQFMSLSFIEAHLHLGLIMPRDKAITAYNHYYHYHQKQDNNHENIDNNNSEKVGGLAMPSGRFIEDYYISGKFMQQRLGNYIRYIGYSLNIEHAQGVDWNRVLMDVLRPCLVIFHRLNVIKSALSGYYGSRLKQLCGISNLKSNRPTTCSDNVIQNQIKWSPLEFAMEVNRWLDRRDKMLLRVDTIRRNSMVPLVEVSYEELLRDSVATREKLLARINQAISSRNGCQNHDASPAHLSDVIAKAPTTSSHTQKGIIDKFLDRWIRSNWRKRSNQTTAEAQLYYYNDINNHLLHSSCQCLQDMLQLGDNYSITTNSTTLGLHSLCQLRMSVDGSGVCISHPVVNSMVNYGKEQ